MAAKLVVIVIVVALDGGLLDGPVHSFDLAVGPGMIGLGEPVFDAVFATGAVEDVLEGMPIALAVGELDAVYAR